MKRRIALVLALGALVAGLVAGVATAATHHKQAPRVVIVKMTEYKFTFVKTPAPLKHGAPILFKVQNKGHLVHNFDIQGVKASKIIGAGKATSILVTFKKAGRFQYICDVPRHAELGMSGVLTVK